MPIKRSEIEREPNRWFHYILDGYDVYREYSQYGNRDVKIKIGEEWGYIHWDQYNALSQPISHLAKWLHEKTGINELLLRAVGYGLVGYGIYKLAK